MNTFPQAVKLAATTKNKALKRELNYFLKTSRIVAALIQFMRDEWLVVTETVIVGVRPPKGVTMKGLIKNFIATAKMHGFTHVTIEDELSGLLFKEKVSRTIPGPARLIRFKKAVYDDETADQLKRLGCYKAYNLSDAIQRATLLVAAGAFNKKKGCDIGIYLNIGNAGTPCWLSVCNARKTLNLRFFNVSADSTSFTGDGLLVDNELFAD